MLKELASAFPELLPWATTCYSTPSLLLYGTVQILSSTGLQQGDPIASLLYALAQQPIVLKVAEEVPDLACHGWLLDDGSAVGDIQQLQTTHKTACHIHRHSLTRNSWIT